MMTFVWSCSWLFYLSTQTFTVFKHEIELRLWITSSPMIHSRPSSFSLSRVLNKLSSSIFSNKTVLVTGHTGFKYLAFRGSPFFRAVVHGASLPCLYQLPHRDILSQHNKLVDYEIDITSTSLPSLIAEIQPDFIFHLAAEAIVSRALADPVSTIKTNVLGTVNVLEGLRRLTKSCPTILVTSDKCYENLEWIYGYREIDKLGGKDPYSASKASQKF